MVSNLPSCWIKAVEDHFKINNNKGRNKVEEDAKEGKVSAS